jgi:short-subunit dehydrogenase
MKHSAITRDLRTKTVVITGATSGVGRATAIAFANYGAKLVLAGRREDALKELVALCKEQGGLAIGVPTDVTDAEALQNLASVANEFGGGIDVWFNNAGVLAAGPFDETPIEVHQQVIEINLLGYIKGAHAVLPYFKKQGRGILINNISVGGWFPVPYGVGYSASKFGLRGYSEALRGELIPYPAIHVCDLFPAFLDTPGIQHAANFTGKFLKPAPPVYDPQQVASSVVSLAIKPRSSMTVGAVATLLKVAHGLFPSVSRFITAKMIDAYLKVAEPVETSTGNLFQPLEYGTSIHGGWNLQSASKGKNVKRGLFALGFVAGLLLLRGAAKRS